MAKAQQLLDAARYNQQGGFYSQAGRLAYSSGHQTAIGWIFQQTGRVAKTHGGAHSEFARLIKDDVRFGLAERQFLGQTYEFKQAADYAIGAASIVSEAEAVQAIAGATNFLEKNRGRSQRRTGGTVPMTQRLAGKTAFVTAAAQGIGRATALAFAAEGARVIATDLNGAKLADIGQGIQTQTLDATHSGDVRRVVQAAGPIDILFNCAGFVHQGTILDSTDSEWDFALSLNLRSMVSTIRAALPGMIERGRGSIINVSSAASSIKGAPNRCVYGTSKAAVIGLTKSVAADFVKRGVRCNAICPGTIQTPSLDDRIAANAAVAGSVEQARTEFVGRQAMGRLGTAEEIAALAVFLASDETQFITGQAIVIDGGWTL